MDISHGISADLRCRVISTISESLSIRKAAKRFGIGVSTAGEWFRRYRDNGETMARKQDHLPPNSPDCNPIEMAFSKLKALLRKGAARTITELWDVIADGID